MCREWRIFVTERILILVAKGTKTCHKVNHGIKVDILGTELCGRASELLTICLAFSCFNQYFLNILP